MAKEGIKRFVKEHKAEIFSVGLMAVGATLCVAGINFIPKKSSGKVIDVDIPTDFMVGKMTDLWKGKGYAGSIVQYLTPKDIGRLGAELLKHGIVHNESNISVVVEAIE